MTAEGFSLALVMVLSGCSRSNDNDTVRESPNPPKVVNFDINGVKFGDSLEKVGKHATVFDDGKHKTLGCLAYSTIDVAGAAVRFDYWFDDSKLVDIQIWFPSWCYEALTEAYIKKFGAPPYKRQTRLVTPKDGKQYTERSVTWKTTSGEFTLQDAFADDKTGYGGFNSYRWNDVMLKDVSKSQENMKKQIEGKL
jgi:hypothetical protein